MPGARSVARGLLPQGSMLIQRILVPVDFSPASEAAARAAALIAGRHRASVALVHTVHRGAVALSVVEPVLVPPEITERLDESKARDAEPRLGELAGKVRDWSGGCDVTIEVLRGGVVEEILSAADRGADLLVIGSSGLHGMARMVLGSTAEEVSRTAPCPVLVVHDREGEPTDWRRVLVGIDFSPLSEGVCRLAAAIGGPGVVLDVVHVWQPPELSTLTVDLGDIPGSASETGRAVADQQAMIARRLGRFVADLDLIGVVIDTHVAVGSPVPRLLERAADRQPDLIALGSHAREGMTERLLGTVAERVLRNAGRPVLLLPRVARDRWTRRP